MVIPSWTTLEPSNQMMRLVMEKLEAVVIDAETSGCDRTNTILFHIDRVRA